MLKWLRDRWRRRDREKRVAAVALKAFRRAYPEGEVIARMTWVSAVGGDAFVVQVCYGRTRPPSRSFWLVEGEEARHLSIDEASSYVELGTWR